MHANRKVVHLVGVVCVYYLANLKIDFGGGRAGDLSLRIVIN